MTFCLLLESAIFRRGFKPAHPNVVVANFFLEEECFVKFGKMLVVSSSLFRALGVCGVLLRVWLQVLLVFIDGERVVSRTDCDDCVDLGLIVKQIFAGISSSTTPWTRSSMFFKLETVMTV